MFDETTTFQITHAQVGADELFGIQVSESQRANTMFPVRTGALDGVPTDEPILVICRSGQRAEVAAASLDARGYRDVRVLAGGLLALASEPGPAQPPR